MPKAATDIMQEILFAAIVDGIDAMKAASKGVPNTLLRDVQSLHRNATFADLPKELQASIGQSVRAAFTRLLKEGYSVAPTSTAPQRPASPIPDRRFDRDRPRSGPRGRGPGDRPRGDRPGGRPGGDRPGGGRPGGGKPGGGRPGGGKPRGPKPE
jgi:hypothetical protein